MKDKEYEIYVRVEEIPSIGKRLLTWVASKNAMPCPLASEGRFGQDAGGVTINTSLEGALKEIDSQIGRTISPQKVEYKMGNPPWEEQTKSYLDNDGLTNHIEKLNHR